MAVCGFHAYLTPDNITCNYCSRFSYWIWLVRR